MEWFTTIDVQDKKGSATWLESTIKKLWVLSSYSMWPAPARSNQWLNGSKTWTPKCSYPMEALSLAFCWPIRYHSPGTGLSLSLFLLHKRFTSTDLITNNTHVLYIFPNRVFFFFFFTFSSCLWVFVFSFHLNSATSPKRASLPHRGNWMSTARRRASPAGSKRRPKTTSTLTMLLNSWSEL